MASIICQDSLFVGGGYNYMSRTSNLAVNLSPKNVKFTELIVENWKQGTT